MFVMGTKGRDIFLWAFFLSALTYIGAWLCGWKITALSFAAISTGVLSLLYYPYELLSRKRSRKNGLRYVVLLPIWPWWAKLLIKMSGGKASPRAQRAYEVHLITPKGIGLADFIAALDKDLKAAEKKHPYTMFLWETTAPLPAHIRTFIRNKKGSGEAFWEKGGWPVPRFGRSKRNGIMRHGFILTEGDKLSE